MSTEEYSFIVFSTFLCGAIVFALLLYTILLKFSKNLGVRNDDNLIRWSSNNKPALGGIGFYIIFLLGIAVYAIFFDPKEVFHNSQTLGLLGACSLAFLMGLADDAYNTRPWLKFGIQVLCAVILIASNNFIDIFETIWLNYLFTIFWVVGIMNSINMLDNMDGITSVISIFIILIGALVLYTTGNHYSFFGFILLAVLASLIGFLFYNWNPSKMFMGDTGSQFLGVFLAFIGVKFFWNHVGIDGESYGSRQFILATLAFLPALADTTIVFINRLSRKQSPFIGGKDHTTHHLSYMGISDSQVAMVFSGISFVSVLLTLFIVLFIENWKTSYLFIFSIYCLLVFFFLFAITQRNKDKR